MVILNHKLSFVGSLMVLNMYAKIAVLILLGNSCSYESTELKSIWFRLDRVPAFLTFSTKE